MTRILARSKSPIVLLMVGLLSVFVSGCMTSGANRETTLVGPYEKEMTRVNGHWMAYVEAGKGDPIVFLHGNPTSSYLWRNIIPHAEGYGRCIAPDLIGMGDSDKLKRKSGQTYSFDTQRDYLDAFLKKVGADKNVILVVHDWGSALGLDWARRNPGAVKAVAHMEGIFISPRLKVRQAGSSPLLEIYHRAGGERFVLQQNGLIEQVLIGELGGVLKEKDKLAYRQPYLRAGESRQAMLAWARQVPYAGRPPRIWQIVSDYSKWMHSSDIPKLFLRGSPGALVQGDVLRYAREFPNQRIETVEGRHFLPEESPSEIASALKSWLENDLGLEKRPVERRLLPIGFDGDGREPEPDL